MWMNTAHACSCTKHPAHLLLLPKVYPVAIFRGESVLCMGRAREGVGLLLSCWGGLGMLQPAAER